MENPAPQFTKLTDPTAEKLGGRILYASNDFSQKKKARSNPKEVFLSQTNTPIMVNGQMGIPTQTNLNKIKDRTRNTQF